MLDENLAELGAAEPAELSGLYSRHRSENGFAIGSPRLTGVFKTTLHPASSSLMM